MTVLSKLKYIIASVCLCLMVACNVPAKKQQQSVIDHTEITFEKMLHPFGKIKMGETVGCYFNFTNSGTFPLVINRVKPGCGCTSIKFPKEPILPGKKGEIEVRFDSKGFSGHQYKVIQVHANIKSKIKELVISANVIN